MCMGFGCNAAGIVGCRIIDSPRERLIAMVTNNFVPCNGRFPTLIAIISMFFVGVAGGAGNTLLSSLLLTLLILFGILMTFAVSKALSMTVLKGVPSSFTLELPPYRRPQIGKVIVRSIFDRTLFVLGRAIVVAAPAGLLIWIMANVYVGDLSLLAHCSAFLDPFARLMGLDGVILMAFILGLPANEIVIPIIIMAYMAQGSLLEFDSLTQLKELLVANGWTWVTAVCTMLFSLMHWPCSNPFDHPQGDGRLEMGDRLLPHPHALRHRAVYAGGGSGRNAGVNRAAFSQYRTTRIVDDAAEIDKETAFSSVSGRRGLCAFMLRLALLFAAP